MISVSVCLYEVFTDVLFDFYVLVNSSQLNWRQNYLCPSTVAGGVQHRQGNGVPVSSDGECMVGV